jgi:hypothetical protein
MAAVWSRGQHTDALLDGIPNVCVAIRVSRPPVAATCREGWVGEFRSVYHGVVVMGSSPCLSTGGRIPAPRDNGQTAAAATQAEPAEAGIGGEHGGS